MTARGPTHPAAALRAVLVLSVMTLLEAVRSRLLWVSLIFSVFLIVASLTGASLALYEQSRLIVDVGLAAASLVGSVVAMSATLVLFAQERQSHTAYVTLARPVARWTLIAGKFFGLWSALWLVVGMMGICCTAVLWAFGAVLPQSFWAAILLTGIEMGLIISLALLLVVLCAPSLAAAYGAALVLASNMSPDIIALAERQNDGWGSRLLWGLFYVLPDVSKLSLRPYVANALPVPDGFVCSAALYGLSYTGALLFLSLWIFSRRASL